MIGGRPVTAPLRSFLKTVEMTLASQDDLIADNRGRRVDRIVQFVGGQDFDRGRILNHNRRPVTPHEVDAISRADGRRVNIGQPLQPRCFDHWLTRCGVKTRQNPAIQFVEIQLVPVQQGLGDIGRIAIEFPDDFVAASDVSLGTQRQCESALPR